MKQKTAKITAFLLIIIVVTSAFYQYAFADDVLNIESGRLYDDSDVIIDANQKPGPVESFLIDFVLSIPKAIMNWLALEDITDLVFMRPTAKNNETVIFENSLNDLSTYLAITNPFTAPLGSLAFNPTYKLSTVLEAVGIDDKKVVFGKDSNQVNKIIQEKIIESKTGYTTDRCTFTEFLNMYVDNRFNKNAFFPRSTKELISKAEGYYVRFDTEKWFTYKDEIYTLRAAYIPASPISENLKSSGVILVTTYGKVTSTGIISNSGIYGSYLHGLFPSEFYGIIEAIRQRLEYLSLYIVMVLIILYGGFKLLIKSSDAESLSYAKELFKGMFMAILLIRFYYYIFEYLSMGNLTLVNYFYGLMTGTEQKISFLDMLYNPSTANIAMTLVTFLAVFMTATMNFQYMIRMLTIGVLYAFTPVAAVLSIVPERRSAVRTWFNELVGNIFTQTIHAAALTFIIKTINAFASSDALKSKTFWVAMAGMMGLNSLAILIRSLMGLEEFKYSNALGFSANMLGLAPLLGIGRMMSRSFKKKGNEQSIPSSHSSHSTASAPMGTTAKTAIPSTGVAYGASTAYRSGTAFNSNLAPATGNANAHANEAAATLETSINPDKFETNYEITEDGLAYEGETFLQKALHSAPAGILRTTGAIGLGLTGGLVMAGAGQNPIGGIMMGANVGSSLGNSIGGSIAEKAELLHAISSKADKDGVSFTHAAKEHFGYHDKSQKYNSAYMGSIGRQIGGAAGALGGSIYSGGARFSRIFSKGAKLNTYANDQNIEYMAALKENIQESKDVMGIEKIKYDNYRSNLTVMEKELGKNIYSDDYKHIESLSKNPEFSRLERDKYKHELETMSDSRKYIPDYYAERTKTFEQELQYTKAQARHNATVSREIEAKNKEEALRRLEAFREQRKSILEEKKQQA